MAITSVDVMGARFVLAHSIIPYSFNIVLIQDCTWTGCVPSKSLLASSKAAQAVQTSSEYGVSCGAPKVDMKAVRDRIRANMDRIYKEDDSPEAMNKLGIDTLSGKATFTSPSTLSVMNGSNDESMTVEAKQGVVVCTGAKPRRPTSDIIEGIENVDYLTYEEIFDLDVLPKKLNVVGGGPVRVFLSLSSLKMPRDPFISRVLVLH